MYNFTPLEIPEEFQNNLVAVSQWLGGYSYLFRFDNGYELSVIKNYGSYGGTSDLFETAILNNGKIICEPDGYRNNSDVIVELAKVRDIK